MAEPQEVELATWLESRGARVRRRKDGSLHTVDFSSAPLAATNDVLHRLGESRRLAVLRLRGATLDDAAAPTLAEFTELTELDLRQTAITNAGLSHLATLRNLKLLHLTGATVTREGVKPLRQALLNCRIVFLE